jgi:hypothetical protein
MAAVKSSGLLPVFQVSVIGEDSDGKCGTFQVDTPVFKRSDYCEQFFVVGVVVLLGALEGF